jgi:RHS repeat-associated protein
VRKSGASGTFNFIYTPDGTLLGEAASGGTALSKEYIWLKGKPVGVIEGSSLYFVRNDHLGRPDVVTNSSGTIMWQASNTAFDRTVPTDSTTFGTLNLGFPGQYYDTESSLWYNGMRYYDATVGRYVSSDPIGLRGGINTYVYALARFIHELLPKSRRLDIF